MRLLGLPPPYWWRPGLSETDELQRATEAARLRKMGAPQHIQRRAERTVKHQVANEAAAFRVREKASSLRLRVLLEDPELTRLWLLGEKNAAAVAKGGKATRKPDIERTEEQQRVLQAFVAQRKKNPQRKFTPTYEAAAKQLGCSPTQVRNVLTDLGINRENYHRVPLD